MSHPTRKEAHRKMTSTITLHPFNAWPSSLCNPTITTRSPATNLHICEEDCGASGGSCRRQPAACRFVSISTRSAQDLIALYRRYCLRHHHHLLLLHHHQHLPCAPACIISDVGASSLPELQHKTMYVTITRIACRSHRYRSLMVHSRQRTVGDSISDSLHDVTPSSTIKM